MGSYATNFHDKLVSGPFQVSFKAEDVKDLMKRLETARWPDELEDEEWQYGTDKKYLKVPR